MTSGAETFRLVSPVFNQNMYSAVREELKPGVSPIDLFFHNVTMNIATFPLLAQAVIHEATIGPGECIFIPAWWWVQSKTVSEESVLILDIDFESHSAMYEVFNKGL